MPGTYKRNLYIGFGFSILILVVSTVASYISINNLLVSSRLVNHTNSVIIELQGLISTLNEAETGQRGYLLTGDADFLEPYHGAYQKALNTNTAIKELTKDNSAQYETAQQLAKVTERRLLHLQGLINIKSAQGIAATAELKKGKELMDEARTIVKTMQDREKELLVSRTLKMDEFAGYTPMFITAAAILSLMITITFYSRLKKDFHKREKLQAQLETKDKDISKRIEIIQEIADKISGGNYHIRVSNEGKDNLGSLAGALNKMAESLQSSFNLLSDKEWLQTGLAQLNEKMIGQVQMNVLTSNIINFVAAYTNSQVGTLYLKENEDVIRLSSAYAFVDNGTRREIKIGEGFAGQCALTGKQSLLTGLDAGSISISYAAGDVRPKNVIVVPIFHEKSIKGVIELGAINEFSKRDMAFLEAISDHIGIFINSTQIHGKLQELLEETQSQTEELHAQHSELQSLNSDLETHAQKLQASEEELRVQQEELMEANEELEERTTLLVERNEIILERNAEIEIKAEQLALSTKYKSEFLANMSHELRTPLNSILLLSGLMYRNNEKTLTDEHVEYAKVIQSSGNGLLVLIDEILDLSKVESGKMELHYDKVEIADIVANMQGLFGPVATEKGIQFRINVDNETVKNIETDSIRLEQVIKNLLSNALKFTSADGSVTLDIFNGTTDGNITFSVKDTGIGIASDKQQLIFEAFQQADGSTRRKFGGTGLGLSISRELVKLLHGDISVKSELGSGSEFSIRIPVLKPVANNSAAEPIIRESNMESKAGINKGPLAETGKLSPYPMLADMPDDRNDSKPGDKLILIVEDDANFAKILLEFTRKNGYKGIVATRGDEGIHLAKTFKPVGILLDIQLPVKNGWEVMEELKNDPKTRHIPIHTMSALELKDESLQKGAVDFINKPVAYEKIMNVFESINNHDDMKERKVLIVEEDPKHAKALAYFLESSDINTEIKENINEGIESLLNEDVDCVILNMTASGDGFYENLDEVRRTKGLETLPIIMFTSKNRSEIEKLHVRKYADSIVVKTAYSYQRILDEVSLFLHVVDKEKIAMKMKGNFRKVGPLSEVLKNKTILIADDDVRNIFSLTKVLETYKIKVLPAMDGKEALRLLNENSNVDIILMDMMMPEMDGYEAIIRIRKNPRTKNIPIIAVTAKAMTTDREKCIQAGASDYITKPVDVDQLLSLLRVWLYERHFNKN